MAARVVQLYCPEHEVTINDFMITPSMDGEAFAISVKSVFRTKSIELEDMWPCDVNGEPLFEVKGVCPSSFKDIASGERLLIAVDEDERLGPEPKLEVVLYLEDEGLPKALRVSTPKVTDLCSALPQLLTLEKLRPQYLELN